MQNLTDSGAAAVLAADAELDVRLDRAGALGGDLDQAAGAGLVDGLERVGRNVLLSEVAGEELARRVARAAVVESISASRSRPVVAHARRTGTIANRDVRGLLGVDRATALAILETAVARDLLEAVGERRARRYLPPR